MSIPPTYRWPLEFFSAITVTVYVLSVITGNVSQVDRVWTFLPTIYTAYWALLPLWPRERPGTNWLFWLWPHTPDDIPNRLKEEYSPRAVMMLVLVTLWMFRLSYNTWRRGLFSLNDEDYRWAVLRKKIPAWFFQVTNLVFIAFIQNIILLLLGIPTHTAIHQPHTLTTSDYICFALGLITLAVEFTADNQQYSFQTFKHNGMKLNPSEQWPGSRLQWTENDAKRGFVTRGLWGWSRHPNFLCEQTFWIIITLIPLVSPHPPNLHMPNLTSGSSFTWELTPIYPILPALVLCLLFFSSTLFTESISMSKYPEAYAAYQERVAMFVPFLTPVWGAIAGMRGRGWVDGVVWGSDVKGKDKRE